MKLHMLVCVLVRVWVFSRQCENVWLACLPGEAELITWQQQQQMVSKVIFLFFQGLVSESLICIMCFTRLTAESRCAAGLISHSVSIALTLVLAFIFLFNSSNIMAGMTWATPFDNLTLTYLCFVKPETRFIEGEELARLRYWFSYFSNGSALRSDCLKNCSSPPQLALCSLRCQPHTFIIRTKAHSWVWVLVFVCTLKIISSPHLMDNRWRAGQRFWLTLPHFLF